MPIQLQTPVPGRLLAEAFGLKGSIRPYLEEAIVPVVNVADLAAAQSQLPVRRQAVARFSVSAVAGQYSQISFIAPMGIAAVISKIVIWGTPDVIKVNHGNSLTVTPAGLTTARYMDWRLLSPTFYNPAVIPTQGNDANALVTYEEQHRTVTANVPIEIDYTFMGGVVVGAGQTTGYFELSTNSVNTAIAGTIFWEEFQLHGV